MTLRRALTWWQRMELVGLTMILVALFLQLVIVANLKDVKIAEDMALNEKLHHIYVAATTGEETYPKWGEIDRIYKGEAKPNDWGWTFDEIDQLVTWLAAVCFFVGSLLTLLGKWLEFKSGSATENR